MEGLPEEDLNRIPARFFDKERYKIMLRQVAKFQVDLYPNKISQDGHKKDPLLSEGILEGLEARACQEHPRRAVRDAPDTAFATSSCKGP